MKEQKVIYPPAVAELIDQFRNEVLCRNEGNQAKAKKIWRELYGFLLEGEGNEISIEWHDYMVEGQGPEKFGECLKRLAAKYRTI